MLRNYPSLVNPFTVARLAAATPWSFTAPSIVRCSETIPQALQSLSFPICRSPVATPQDSGDAEASGAYSGKAKDHNGDTAHAEDDQNHSGPEE